MQVSAQKRVPLKWTQIDSKSPSKVDLKPKFRMTIFLTLCLSPAHTHSGALLDQSQKLLNRGTHPTIVSQSFQEAAKKYGELNNMQDGATSVAMITGECSEFH